MHSESFASHDLINLRLRVQAAAFVRAMHERNDKSNGAVDICEILNTVARQQNR